MRFREEMDISVLRPVNVEWFKYLSKKYTFFTEYDGVLNVFDGWAYVNVRGEVEIQHWNKWVSSHDKYLRPDLFEGGDPAKCVKIYLDGMKYTWAEECLLDMICEPWFEYQRRVIKKEKR